jgi:hypothetical protein
MTPNPADDIQTKPMRISAKKGIIFTGEENAVP